MVPPRDKCRLGGVSGGTNMETIRLGRTELYVTKTAFGALPIQRISKEDAARLVRRAYDAGVNYFDTANKYTDSEEKLGIVFDGIR